MRSQLIGWGFGLPGGVEFEHEGGEEFLIIGEKQGVRGADHKDNIIAFGPIVLVERKAFAEEAFDAVAARGGATAREMLMPRRGWGDCWGGRRRPVAAGGFDAVLEDGREIGARADAVGVGKE